jgi:Zn-dependent protease
MSHELTHTSFLGRILVPIGARQNARRLRDHCEAAAGTASPLPGSRLGAALMTGALTYASFIYLFDWQFAAVLLALLVVHECGHALAMRWVGMPVQGIYFIPFFGGVAVSAAPHESEAERGFVALMGPGLSLVSTGAFVYAAAATGEPIFAQLALVSAILNGINLAPVLPLDGGHVLDAALSRTDPGIVSVVNMLALIAGVGVSVYLGWYVLTGLLLLTAPAMLRNRESKRRRAEPISPASRNWLVAGYLATVAFYIAVATHYLV